jgi:hypothetical protein
MNIVTILRSKSANEFEQLLNRAPTYITDNNFLNLINNFQVSPIDNREARQTDTLLQQQFDTGSAQLKNQIEKWLSL